MKMMVEKEEEGEILSSQKQGKRESETETHCLYSSTL